MSRKAYLKIGKASLAKSFQTAIFFEKNSELFGECSESRLDRIKCRVRRKGEYYI